MKKQIIAYDLRTPGKDYSSLKQAISRLYPSSERILESTWCVATTDTSGVIRDKLKVYMDSNDRLFVSESVDWASRNAMSTKVLNK